MFNFTLFLVLNIITHCVRTTYEILKIKNKINSENKILFIFIFTNMFILWLSWFGLCSADPYTISLNPILKYFGAILLIIGVILFFLSLAKIKRFENYQGELITNGIYRFLRHPMYLSFILWLAGGVIFYGSIVGFILAILNTANILYWKKLEEIHLMKVFPEYAEYRKRTYF